MLRVSCAHRVVPLGRARATGLAASIAVLAAGCSASLSELTVAEPTVVPVTAADAPEPTATPTTGTGSQPTPPSDADTSEEAPVMRLAVKGAAVFDPSMASPVRPTDMVVADLLYDGLTEWDLTAGTWRPRLAESLESSADGLEWTVTLGVHRFSDGRMITASDVVASFAAVRAQGSSLAAARLEQVDAVVATRPDTVVFRLSEPFALLPALLSSPVYGIVPDAAPDGTVSSGPLVLADEGLLEPVQDGQVGLGGGLGGVVLVTVTDDADAVRLRDAGQVDLAYVSATYEGVVDLAVSAAVEAHYVLNAGSPELADAEVRRTVIAAIGRTAVTEASFGDAAIAIDQLVPDLLACVAPCRGGTDGNTVDDPAGDPAGHPVEDPEPGEPTAVPKLSLAYVVDPAGREAAMADAVVAELADAGIEVVASGYALDTFVERVGAGADDLIRTGWVGLFPSPDSQLAPYRSGSSDNVSGFAAATFDELLAAARQSGDAAAYLDAQAYLAQQAVVLPVARLQVRALVSDRVGGLVLRHDGTFGLDGLTIGSG